MIKPQQPHKYSLPVAKAGGGRAVVAMMREKATRRIAVGIALAVLDDEETN